MNSARSVTVPDLARLPAFSHAVVAGEFIFVSGTLGTEGDAPVLVEGGVGPETRRTLENIEAILAACAADRHHIVKVNVFLADMASSAAMNAAYQDFFGDEPPARITVGGVDLALGAAVEIDCVAYRPS